MIFRDGAQARLHAGAEDFAAFAVRRAGLFNLVQPLVHRKVEAVPHGGPIQTRPIAEINFAQIRHHRLFVRAGFERGRQRLLNAFHGTCIDCVNRLGAQVFREYFRLAPAARREVHVNATTENAVVTRFHFAVPNQQQSRGGRRRYGFTSGNLGHNSTLGDGVLLRGEQVADAGLAECE